LSGVSRVGIEQLVVDYFLACFPPDAMKNIIYQTSQKLEEDKQTTRDGIGKLLKFYGVLILITQF
jgi:hypothetical protein